MKSFAPIALGIVVLSAMSCSSSSSIHERTNFSKTDSLTDAYLVLNDSLLQSWNRIVQDEIEKSRTLQELFNDLDEEHQLSEDIRTSILSRMEALDAMRFDQHDMIDPQVVEDYDKAWTSLVNDIASASKTASVKATIDWFDWMKKNTDRHRNYYDSLASTFNEFVSRNKSSLMEFNTENQLDPKPLFWETKKK